MARTHIELLDDATINKIAAGEVVERPVSVVKELTENALDAGASLITVEIREGGTSYIRVSDNGCGIPSDEIRLAFLRHSTSKITSVEDLARTLTLGFRGEALASVAAVARVELLTKTEEELTGIRYLAEGGRELLMEEAAVPTGTTVKVENLFFNVPARRKFLKKASVEAAAITDYLQRLILGHPEVSFRYLNGRQEPTLFSTGRGGLKNALFAVYGRDVVDKCLPIEAESEALPGLRLSGFISRPQLCRPNRSLESLFINGRWVRSALVDKALDEAYKDYIVPGTFPVFVLHLSMDPTLLDVNVHPTKMEVRFTREEELRGFLYEAFSACLREASLVSREGRFYEVPETAAKPAVKPSAPMSSPLPGKDAAAPAANPPVSAPHHSPAPVAPVAPSEPRQVSIFAGEKPAALPEPPELCEEPLPYGSKDPKPQLLRLIGQLFETYWLAEGEGLLYVMDQHAAHERVLYDRFRRTLAEGPVDSQLLLEPMTVTMPPREVALLPVHQDTLTRLGFEVEVFGEDAVIVRAVPYIFNGPMEAEDMITLMSLLSEGNRFVSRDLLLDKLAMTACKAAVKGNSRMSFCEAEQLLVQLFASDNPYNCPHGRPTVISVSRYDIERRFKRA